MLEQSPTNKSLVSRGCWILKATDCIYQTQTEGQDMARFSTNLLRRLQWHSQWNIQSWCQCRWPSAPVHFAALTCCGSPVVICFESCNSAQEIPFQLKHWLPRDKKNESCDAKRSFSQLRPVFLARRTLRTSRTYVSMSCWMAEAGAWLFGKIDTTWLWGL